VGWWDVLKRCVPCTNFLGALVNEIDCPRNTMSLNWCILIIMHKPYLNSLAHNDRDVSMKGHCVFGTINFGNQGSQTIFRGHIVSGCLITPFDFLGFFNHLSLKCQSFSWVLERVGRVGVVGLVYNWSTENQPIENESDQKTSIYHPHISTKNSRHSNSWNHTCMYNLPHQIEFYFPSSFSTGSIYVYTRWLSTF